MSGMYGIRIFILFLTIFFFFGFGGCGSNQEPIVPDYVIKTDQNMISKEDFILELDLKLTAYPYDFKKDVLEYNQMVLDLVSILSEEIVLLSAARDREILVSGVELDEAEAFFREDYPEDSFEKMLLENAISYLFWKKKLEKNLIIDKFIQQELKDKIEIKPEDIVAFYKRHVDQGSHKNSSGTAMDENRLVSQLRLEKSQESYEQWVMEFKKQYPVDINKKIISGFLIDMENKKEQTKKEQ